MLRLWGSRRAAKGARAGPSGTSQAARPGGKGRRCELSTTPPDTPSRHLLPCHVRLLDGTDLYIQIVVSYI